VCWSRVGRMLDDVWTTVTVIGLNSHQRKVRTVARNRSSTVTGALEVKPGGLDLGKPPYATYLSQRFCPRARSALLGIKKKVSVSYGHSVFGMW